jgi:type IV pilus assembly protein PilA
MRRLLGLAILLFALPAFAQYPEVDAAVDALMAKDLPAFAKHLPPALEKDVAGLPINEQRELSEELLPSRILNRQGAVVKRSESSEAIVVIEQQDSVAQHASPAITIRLDKRISDGSECLLQLSLHAGDRPPVALHVWMKYVDSEWRIYQLQDTGEERKIDFDAPDLIAKKRHTDINSNEASAIGSMRSYNTAAVTYASTYPDIGFPQTAEDLGQPSGPEEDAHHAGFLDNALTMPPFEKSGYRFSFQGGKENYTVIARPIKFGVSGNRSFFSNETGVIRSTDKDEEPTEHDEPVK